MQQGGSPYGAPPHQAELPPFHHVQIAPEAAPPISTRPPPTGAVAPNYEELGAGEDPLGGPGEEGGAGGISGNRWPRQETLALLKIRSDMDATFRDSTLKGPLWEEVSRKLAELGYKRNSKKCKEKFENVHKYYKRTKEGRGGRQDGKSYRFFTQLEALHNNTAAAAASSPPVLMATPPPPSAAPAAHNQKYPSVQPMQISAPTPITTAPPAQPQPVMVPDNPINVSAFATGVAAGISFSTNSSSSSSSGSESDEDEVATEEGPSGGRKRKREQGGRSGKMMAFFEGLMRQVMERQETMQRRFLEAIEKREQDRMNREEAWRMQEMSRMSREHELAAQEWAAAASRDAAIISFLQKVNGQTVLLPPSTAVIQIPPPSQPQIHSHQKQQQTLPPQPPQQIQQQNIEIARQHHPPPPPALPAASTELVPVASSEAQEGMVVSMSVDPASSRWPKSEVHALIKIRSGLDSRYQESGPKGPLWEEISASMQRLGYKRSAKRCKEKWENINKYFKKVKESNKKRPEDAKTCPYFHQLDALYRSKHSSNSGGGSTSLPALTHSNPNPNLNTNPSPISMIAPPPAPQAQQGEMESKKGNGGNAEAGGGGASNGGIGSNFFGEGSSTDGGGGGENSGIMKKPEDIVKELMGPANNDNYGKLDEPAESENMDEDDEDEEDDDDEDGKGQYRIQFQTQNVSNSSSGSGGATTAPSTGGKASGSFLAMVR